MSKAIISIFCPFFVIFLKIKNCIFLHNNVIGFFFKKKKKNCIIMKKIPTKKGPKIDIIVSDIFLKKITKEGKKLNIYWTK